MGVADYDEVSSMRILHRRFIVVCWFVFYVFLLFAHSLRLSFLSSAASPTLPYLQADLIDFFTKSITKRITKQAEKNVLKELAKKGLTENDLTKKELMKAINKEESKIEKNKLKKAINKEESEIEKKIDSKDASCCSSWDVDELVVINETW